MKIDLYTVSWNEGDVLEFFFRHYDRVVDRYVVYDDGSSDNTLAQLSAHPKVEIRSFQRELADSFVLSHQKMQNEAWKEAKDTADWIIVTAIDEHLVVEGTDLRTYLAEAKAAGITAIPAIGYQMISEQFPQSGELLCRTRTLGAPSVYMNKLSIFDPTAISDTGFGLGRHQSIPTGNVRFPIRDELMLFHYKRLGFEHTFSRHVDLGKRLGKIDNANGWGAHYHLEREKFAEAWDSLRDRAIDLTQSGFACSKWYEPPLWWRQSAE